MIRKRYSIIILIVFLLSGCGQKPKEEKAYVPENILNQGMTEVSDQNSKKSFDNISSPIEIASLIKKIGVPYSNAYLFSPSDDLIKAPAYKKAMVLGILEADLSYLNVYKRYDNMKTCIDRIHEVSGTLNVQDVCATDQLNKIACTKGATDSMSFHMVRCFNEMDKNLKDNKKGNLSAIMISGIWLESLYMITQVAKKYPDKQIIEKIGEQKILLEKLMIALYSYSKDAEFAPYIEQFELIKNEFASVKVSYQLGNAEAIEKNDKLVIIQHEKCVITISDAILKKITTTTEAARKKMILDSESL